MYCFAIVFVIIAHRGRCLGVALEFFGCVMFVGFFWVIWGEGEMKELDPLVEPGESGFMKSVKSQAIIVNNSACVQEARFCEII